MLPYTIMSSEDTFEEIESSSCKSSKDSINKSATNELNKQLVFKLSWPTRDEIIVLLNRYTRLFCGEKANGELAKDKLMNDNANLYQVLLNLPLKSDVDHQTGCQSSRVTLDVDSGIRSQMVNTLLSNHSLVLHTKSASQEEHMNVVEQNSDLICKLVKLPFSKTTADESDESALGDNADQLTQFAEEIVRLGEMVEKKQSELVEESVKHSEEVARLNIIIKAQKLELNEKSNKNFDLNRMLDELKKTNQAIEGADLLSRVAKLSIGQVDVGLNRKKVVFDYELNGVNAFLESEVNRFSEYFFAGGLAWYLSLTRKTFDDDRHLSIYLGVKDYADAGDWSIKADYEISIVDRSWAPNWTCGSKNEFGTKNSVCFGWPRFISVKDLRACSFIKDDKVLVRVHLKLTGELVRSK